MRVFALSDIHVDYTANMTWLQAISATDYTDDTLLLAGDVSGNLDTLQAALTCVRAKFAQVFFVPGNHELWIRKQQYPDSIAKFERILRLCSSLGVTTSPAQVDTAPGDQGVWIVPLFSWYRQLEEGSGSLFVPKQGEDPTLEMWADNYLTRWPSWPEGVTVADAFLHMNEPHLHRQYDAPVISFSHFLPRTELIFRTQEEYEAAAATGVAPSVQDPHPRFNFSRVAGCLGLDGQIRQLGSVLHVYGHQHRNRHRQLDGVLYVSHCLGYPREREHGQIHHIGDGPRLIWDTCGAI